MSNKNLAQTKNQTTILTLEDLEKWFKDLKNIILDINISINNIKRMRLPTDENEIYILNHGFFYHFYLQSIFATIIQLCKLFSNSRYQRRSFNKLFNRLNDDKYDIELNELLFKNADNYGLFNSKTDINFEIVKLTNEIAVHKDLINNIIILRDSCYAHSDPDANIPNVSNADLELLKTLANGIYNTLSSKLLNNTFMFEMTSDWAVDYPIRILALKRKERLDEIEKKLK